ncbi:MAG: hypothetical protein K2X03_07060 [Bryobacteraceae bacterium]|nr:hypothetical protein [Bryobacteraceae bacterium]
MREERRVTEWLAEYRDSLDAVSTPSAVEARLRAEVRRRQRVSVSPWWLAAGAAALLALGIWIGRPRAAALPAPVVAQAPAALPAEPVEIVQPARVQPVVVMPAPRQTRLAQPAPAPVAVFVMLPGSEYLPPAQDVQVMRVRIPRTRIQSLGWPVNVDRLEERVLADVLVGEDGVPRAVRLVQ